MWGALMAAATGAPVLEAAGAVADSGALM